ncbi:unnamed protein product [Rhizophagus irregularis]|nr:unnamed protein product [Rhizophagus irregularis]
MTPPEGSNSILLHLCALWDHLTYNRTIVDINLTCRLNKKTRTFTVKMNTGNDVNFLKEKIKQKFSCNDARDIKLWKLDRVK